MDGSEAASTGVAAELVKAARWIVVLWAGAAGTPAAV